MISRIANMNPGIAKPMMMTAEVHVSKREPSATALRMPSGIEPLCAAVFRIYLVHSFVIVTASTEIDTAAGNARTGTSVRARQLRDHPLHWAAGRELHHDERHEQDAEHRRRQ